MWCSECGRQANGKCYQCGNDVCRDECSTLRKRRVLTRRWWPAAKRTQMGFATRRVRLCTTCIEENERLGWP